MSKIDKLKQTYIADAEMMASKSRFGYFSLLPSHTAAITDNSAPTRNSIIIQHTATPMERCTLSLETFTPGSTKLELSRKTTFLIHRLPSMAPPTKIQENINASRNCSKAKNGKEKMSTNRPASTKPCNSSLT